MFSHIVPKSPLLLLSFLFQKSQVFIANTSPMYESGIAPWLIKGSYNASDRGTIFLHSCGFVKALKSEVLKI
eukprot:Pgem_evm1s17722